MNRRDDRPQTTQEVVQQGVVSFVLLAVVLVLVNRFLRDAEWGAAVVRSLQFAVPFVIVFTALQVFLANRRAGS
jgi:hypothetical protein